MACIQCYGYQAFYGGGGGAQLRTFYYNIYMSGQITHGKTSSSWKRIVGF